MKDTLLVTLADKNFIDQAKQLFSSVYFNAGWKGDYMLLAHEIPEKDLKWFRDKGILVKKCRKISNNGWGCWSPILLDKFYLFTPEFKKWKTIIYLDADIIVRTSLDRLANVNSFAAVKVIFPLPRRLSKSFKDTTETKKILNKLRKEGYNLKKFAFSAGVFSFNTDIIQNNSFSKLVSLFKNYNKLMLWDEETIINLYFNKRLIYLPLTYNLPILSLKDFYNLPFKKIKGKILHFSISKSVEKPWSANSFFYKEWKENLNKAEFINLKKIYEDRDISLAKDIPSFYIIIKKTLYLIKHFLNQLINRVKQFFIYLINTLDRFIGKIGILLKKYNPNLYYELKKKST